MIQAIRKLFLEIPRWLSAILAVSYAASIFGLSSLERASLPTGGYVANLLHAPLFGGLALLVILALVQRSRLERTPHLAVLSWVVVAIYAGIDEVHQAFTPGREASLGDAVTDALGAALMLLGVSRILSGRPRDGLLVRWVAVLVVSIAASAFVA
ncbi:MAG: VanZ family protein [Planctomycetota bacterium]